MFFNDFKYSFQPSFPLKSIGKRQDLIPNHIIKWTYKKGIDKIPTPGQTIFCNFGVSLIDGTQLTIPNEYTVSKFLFGRERLIDGLEIVFSKSKKGEVFKVKISSDYAYKDRQDIEQIPPFSSLIFDITIIDIQKLDIKYLSISQVLSQMEYAIQKADDQLRKGKSDLAVQLLEEAFNMNDKIRIQKSSIGEKLVVKMANILLKDQRPDDALKMLHKYQRFDEYYFLKTKCKLKIYELKGQSSKMIKQMLQKYYLYQTNQPVKKYIRNYFKKVNANDLIAKLDQFQTKRLQNLQKNSFVHLIHFKILLIIETKDKQFKYYFELILNSKVKKEKQQYSLIFNFNQHNFYLILISEYIRKQIFFIFIIRIFYIEHCLKLLKNYLI